MKRSLLTVVLAFLAILLFFASIGFAHRQRKQTPENTPSPRKTETTRPPSSSPQTLHENEWTVFQDQEIGLELRYPPDWDAEDFPRCDMINTCTNLSGKEGMITIELEESIQVDEDEYIDEQVALENFLKDKRSDVPSVTPSELRIGSFLTVQSINPQSYERFHSDTRQTQVVQETVYYVSVPRVHKKIYWIYSFAVERDPQVLDAETVLRKILTSVRFQEPPSAF